MTVVLFKVDRDNLAQSRCVVCLERTVVLLVRSLTDLANGFTLHSPQQV